jgi:tetratricopeptide (TPR) repeat protein
MRQHLKLALSAGLFAVTFGVYAPVLRHEFVNFDDDHYILDSPGVRLGLTPRGIAWAFGSGYGANWFPLTWLSWMFDYSIWGLDPRGFHLTSLLLHCGNAVLLFLVLARLTGAALRSAFVAGVFALHPLHVESVAWAAVRKDVLSGLFWILTMAAYGRYAERPSRRRYWLVPLCLALGLMAKPMLVTLPFVLLLLDAWPLGRLRTEAGGGIDPARLRAALLEKAPLFLLVMLSSAVTLAVQRGSGALVETYPLGVRLANALVSYLDYLRTAFWPAGLAVYYPHPGDSLSAARSGLAFLVLAALSALFLAHVRTRPAVAVGWLWFLGTLVPVIGLVQVGEQARADRYMYIPLIGISLVVAWGVPLALARLGMPRAAPPILAGLGLTALAAVTSVQLRVWRDSTTLFSHALRVTKHNALAHLNLGIAYSNQGRIREAESHLAEAIRLHPGSAEGHAALGEVYARERRSAEAERHLAAALRLDPASSRTRESFGRLLLEQGRIGEAISQFREAVAADPLRAGPYVGMGGALLRQGSFVEAADYFQKAVSLDPGSAEAHNNWGVALLNRGEIVAAIERFRSAASLDPALADAHANWGLALARQGDPAGAAERYRAALALRPDDADLRQALGLALAHRGRFGEAIEQFRAALAVDPDHAEARYGWGLALANLGRLPEAIERYRETLALRPGHAGAHNAWGIALGSLGRLAEADGHFREAVALRDDYAEAYNNWALSLARRGRLREAIARLRRAVAIDASYVDARNNLGVFLARAGHPDEAVRHFREAVRLDPGRADARANLEKLLNAGRERP